MKTLVFAGLMLIFSTGWLACKKSKSDNPAAVNKLLQISDKDWRSHKTETSWYILRFNSDSTGYQKNIQDLTTGTYITYNFKWSRSNDSIKLSYDAYLPITFRVYSVNDSILVMNNWRNGGVKDSTKVKLYCTQ